MVIAFISINFFSQQLLIISLYPTCLHTNKGLPYLSPEILWHSTTNKELKFFFPRQEWF
uniref:Uncharacterized protein n=1 Tax=Rhizophora mucronata TaxID=61149 RepID=A0A2P2QUK1_RHIMU